MVVLARLLEHPRHTHPCHGHATTNELLVSESRLLHAYVGVSLDRLFLPYRDVGARSHHVSCEEASSSSNSLEEPYKGA